MKKQILLSIFLLLIICTSLVSAGWVTPKENTYVYGNTSLEDGTTTGQLTYWNGSTWTYTETSELFWDDTNKRVGIGTDSPASILEVRQATGVPKIRIVADASDYAGIDFLTKDGNVCQFEAYKGNFNFNAKNELRFLINDGTRAMTIKTTGNIGIGTDTPTSTLQTVGSVSNSISTKTSDYTLTVNDSTILLDGSSNTVTATLPTAVGITGRIYNLKCIDDTYTITVDGNGSETIDGELTQTLNNWENMKIQSTGTNWVIL